MVIPRQLVPDLCSSDTITTHWKKQISHTTVPPLRFFLHECTCFSSVPSPFYTLSLFLSLCLSLSLFHFSSKERLFQSPNNIIKTPHFSIWSFLLLGCWTLVFYTLFLIHLCVFAEPTSPAGQKATSSLACSAVLPVVLAIGMTREVIACTNSPSHFCQKKPKQSLMNMSWSGTFLRST